MDMKAYIEQLMISVALGEASQEEVNEFNEMLHNSPELRLEFEGVNNTLNYVDTNLEVPDPGDAYWDGVWSDVQNRMILSESKRGFSFHWFNVEAWQHFWRPALQLATVATVLLLGIFIGSSTSQQELPADNGLVLVEDQIFNDPDLVRSNNNMMVNVADHSLSRSEQILEDFMKLKVENGDSGDWGSKLEDRSAYLTLADELMVLRQAKSDPRISKLAPIIEELEMIIGELARLDSEGQGNTYQVVIIQQGIKENDLQKKLRKIRSELVVEMEDEQ